MQVKDIMTAQTEFIAADASLRDAAMAMTKHDIGFLPVRDGGQVVGVVTDRDLALRPASRCPNYDGATVGDIMTPSAHAIRSNAPLAGAATAMKHKRVRRLLVLDDDAQLVGVLALSDLAKRASKGDLAAAVIRHLATARPQPKGPAAQG